MLEKIFIIAFIVLSFHASTRREMTFGKMQDWLAPLSDAIKKPLFYRPACMSAWWGTAVYWIIWGNSWRECIICVIATIGLNYLISIFLPPDE